MTIVLAFDTSDAHCAAALMAGGALLGQALEPMAKGQAERLPVLLGELLAANDLGWSDISRIGVGIGPGNFTGIRISVAFARGLAMGLNIPALGVSNFDAYAFQITGDVIASVDARAGGIYLQAMTKDPSPVVWQPDGARPDFEPDRYKVVGHAAEQVARAIGGSAVEQTVPVAVAIARIASMRDAASATPPKPLYVRSPAAAPARDKGPKILT